MQATFHFHVGERTADPAQDVVAYVRDRVEYVRGSTAGVLDGARGLGAEGKGVCQDLTHVTISLLRALGIPTRYVSGYLHSDPDAPIPAKPSSVKATPGSNTSAARGWASTRPTPKALASTTSSCCQRSRLR